MVSKIAFHTIRTPKGWVVVRTYGEYSQHAHVYNRETAINLIALINKGIMPKSKYLVGSAKRLLSEEEFNNLLDKRKEMYYNVNKGIKY